MAIIQSNVPLPKPARLTRRLSATAQELFETLSACKEGDSFVIAGEYRTIANVAGRMAKRLGASVQTATEFAGATRVWRIAAKPARAKKV